VFKHFIISLGTAVRLIEHFTWINLASSNMQLNRVS